MKRVILAHIINDVRDCCWTLVQEDDGTLHVEQEAIYGDGVGHRRVVPINDFMRENGPPPRMLHTLIDRMFSVSESVAGRQIPAGVEIPPVAAGEHDL